MKETSKLCGFLAQEKRRDVSLETISDATLHRVLSQGTERTGTVFGK